MSGYLRHISLRRLLILCVATVAVGIAGTAIAFAVGNGPTPQPKPLAQAVHDALTAPKVSGVSARVQLTDRLVEGTSLASQSASGGAGGASNPLLSGASGRIWISAGGRVRLELQSEHGATQLLYDGHTLTLYDAATHTRYEYTPPSAPGGSHAGRQEGGQVPSVAEIQKAITTLMGHVDIGGAIPTDIAGQPAYSVRISPKRGGGLVGSAELAWDAVHGVPLRLAIYAKGEPAPVLELSVTEVSYGAVPSSVFSLSLPAGVKTTVIKPAAAHVDRASSSRGAHQGVKVAASGLAAVSSALPFRLQAPSTLAGMQRRGVRLIEVDGHDAALVSYGEGLGGISVIEAEAKATESKPAPSSRSSLSLPTVSINGVKAQELPTALGTMLSYRSGGVQHILAGSVTPSVIETAARGL